jgi:hypothetical protein
MGGDPKRGLAAKPPSRVGDTGITATSTLEVYFEDGDPIPNAIKQAKAWASTEPKASALFWVHLESTGFSVTSTPRSPTSSVPVKTPESKRIGLDFAAKMLHEAVRRGLILGDEATDRYWAKPSNRNRA